MPVAKGVSAKRGTLNLRIKPAERGLIDRAAKAKGKTVLILYWRCPCCC